jgi:hypothetical protein
VKTVQQILVCALLSALVAVAVFAALLLDAARRTVSAIPTEIACTRAEVLAEVAATRQDLTGQIAAARQDLLMRTERQVAALRTDAMTQVGDIRETTDRRVGDTLSRVDAALARVDDLRGDFKPLLANSAALAADTQASMDDLYWDLKASVESATVAANSLGQTSLDIRATVPRTITTWDGIGANIQAISKNVDRLTKPHWYDRLLGYGLNGIILYRNLNPATNLTVKGAQAISGRP